MRRVAIQGSQWGDEGKGKITDFFSSQADIVVRYQGGNNAGHTIVFDNKKFAVRLLPSGIFHKNVMCVLASGMVISPKDFFEEVETLKKAGYDTSRILISDRASVLLPYHRILDSVNEKVLDKQKIGTTGKGIGPCYTDKASRIGLRMGEMVDPDILKNHLKKAIEFKNRELRSYNLEEINFDELYKECLIYGEKLKPYVTDTSIYLSNAIKENKRILF